MTPPVDYTIIIDRPTIADKIIVTIYASNAAVSAAEIGGTGMNRFVRKTLSLIMVLSMVIGIAGFAHIDPTYAATGKIHLAKTTISKVVGQTYQQKLYNKNGKAITATKVTWKSAKTSVAKISKKGKITAVKAGTAKMTAKYNGITYKFTVKVSKPFTSGEKPTISIAVGNDQTLTLNWEGKSLSGLKGELMYAVNDGTFEKYDELITNGFSMPGVLWNKYTFKLRWVYYDSYNKKNYYSSYSDEESVTVALDHNTMVDIDETSLTLVTGETKTIHIRTDAGKALTYEPSNSDNPYATCKWGGWLPDGSHTNTLKITGVEKGTTTIEVFDAKSPTVRDSITVTVNPEWTITCEQEMPLTITSKGSGGSVLYEAQIESINLTTSEDAFKIIVIGTMVTYNSGTPDLEFRVLDQDGYVVTGGVLATNSKEAGLKFKINRTFELPDAKGNYTLVFYNAN